MPRGPIFSVGMLDGGGASGPTWNSDEQIERLGCADPIQNGRWREGIISHARNGDAICLECGWEEVIMQDRFDCLPLLLGRKSQERIHKHLRIGGWMVDGTAWLIVITPSVLEAEVLHWKHSQTQVRDQRR